MSQCLTSSSILKMEIVGKLNFKPVEEFFGDNLFKTTDEIYPHLEVKGLNDLTLLLAVALVETASSDTISTSFP